MLSNIYLWTIALWIFCVIWAALAGHKKGLSAPGWGLAALFFGPLTLIVVLLWPSDEQALEDRYIALGMLKTCPGCDETCRQQATICRHCGTTFPDAPSTSEPIQPQDA